MKNLFAGMVVGPSCWAPRLPGTAKTMEFVAAGIMWFLQVGDRSPLCSGSIR
jgi:hypothetical protein